jgi:hypothetical protein
MGVVLNRVNSHLKPIDRIIDPPGFPAGCGRSHLAAIAKVPEHCMQLTLLTSLLHHYFEKVKLRVGT